MSHMLKGVEGAMRGYRPQVDWGGEEGSAMIIVGGHNVKVGTEGWRRRCLFTLLSALLLLSILNLVLTFWLLRKIDFNAEGAGSLHVKVGGVKLEGISRFDHDIAVASIRGRPQMDLNISAFYNLTIATFKENIFGSAVLLDSNGVTVYTKGFRMTDDKDTVLFEAKQNYTSVGAKFFVVSGLDGAIFHGSLETPRLLGDEVHEFRIENPTGFVNGTAGNLFRVEARDGDVTATSTNDITLKSTKGKFRFESPNVFAPDLIIMGKETSPLPVPTTPSTDTQIPRPNVPPATTMPTPEVKVSPENFNKSEEEIQVFQVCVCPSGRLFLSAADSVCIPDELTCR